MAASAPSAPLAPEQLFSSVGGSDGDQLSITGGCDGSMWKKFKSSSPVQGIHGITDDDETTVGDDESSFGSSSAHTESVSEVEAVGEAYTVPPYAGRRTHRAYAMSLYKPGQMAQVPEDDDGSFWEDLD